MYSVQQKTRRHSELEWERWTLFRLLVYVYAAIYYYCRLSTMGKNFSGGIESSYVEKWRKKKKKLDIGFFLFVVVVKQGKKRGS